MKNFKVKFSLFFLLFSTVIKAQTGGWTDFTLSDGLPGLNVTSMIEDSQGNLWFGTRGGGVCKFDGQKWTNYTKGDGLLDSRVLSMTEDSKGNFWFGTEYEGVFCYDGKTWTQYNQENGAEIGIYVWTLIEDRNGVLWFGSHVGLSCYDGQKWYKFAKFDDFSIRIIYEDKKGFIYVGTYGNGVFRYNGSSWSSISGSGCFTDNEIISILEDSRGIFWYGTPWNGVCRNEGSNWQNYNSSNCNLAGDEWISSIVEDSNGNIWFGTDDGVSCFDGQNWETFTETDGLVFNTVTAIIEDSQGVMWFATGQPGGGVSRYYGNSWKTFNSANGLPHDVVYSILEDKKGNIWAGTSDGGIAHNNGQYWITDIDVINDLPPRENLAVRTIFEDREGNLWFSYGRSGGLKKYDGQTWTNVNVFDIYNASDVRAITEDNLGNLWVGSYVGASVFNGANWQTLRQADGLASNSVSAILKDSQGNSWYGCYKYDDYYWYGKDIGYGVTLFDGVNWTTFTMEHGLPHNLINILYEDSKHRIWAGTNSGLALYNGTDWDEVTSGAMVGRKVVTILEDTLGALWFGTDYPGIGIHRYDGQNWTAFSIAEGLADDTVFEIFEATNGDLWVATLNGLSRLRDKIAPKTVILVKPGILNENVSPQFSYLAEDNITPQNRILYSWSLIYVYDEFKPHSEGDWSFQTNVRLSDLENGNYIFTVRSKDIFGNVSSKPAKYSFSSDVTPPTVNIISPKENEIISGEVKILGSAFDVSPSEDFSKWQLDFVFGDDPSEINENDWLNIIKDRKNEIRNDSLTLWNTNNLTNGNYLLRLFASDNLGHTSEDIITVEVVNSSDFVTPKEGTVIFVDKNQLELYIPPNTFDREVQIYCRDKNVNEINLSDNPDMTNTEICFELFADDTVLFNKPVTILANEKFSLQRMAWQIMMSGQ